MGRSKSKLNLPCRGQTLSCVLRDYRNEAPQVTANNTVTPAPNLTHLWNRAKKESDTKLGS